MFKVSLFFFAALLAVSSVNAQTIEHVISHNEEIIVTDPSKGANSYKRNTVFPSKDKDIRQIKLILTFECPEKDSMRCADWDYVDHINVIPENSDTKYEVARMLTPYGGRFQKDWIFQWEVDVTDFSEILRNEVVVDYIHTGYEDNKTRGWKVTVDFEITYGTPVAKPLAIHKIYDGNYSYGDTSDPIENHLKPVSLKANAATAFSKVKVHQTGHGMDANGCGEFCDKWRDILYNGEVVNHKDIWMKCGDNPLYPQAGTWIFDRANWCPGYLLQPDEVLIDAKKGESFTVDINMQPYETEKPSAKELLVAYVVEYGAISAENDVTLIDIIKPSSKRTHSRVNPTGGRPLIKIKNNGSKNLTKLTVKYYLDGQKPKRYNWTGNLAFNEETLITLPEEIFSEKEETGFTVALSKPNGKRDGYMADNVQSATYQKPDILPGNMVVYFKTNEKPGQNTYRVEDSFGNVVFKKDSTDLMPNKLHQDTLKLAEGGYSFIVDDTGNNGLEFWFHAKEGVGNIKILDTLGQAIKQFGSDFGKNITYNFTVKHHTDYTLDPKPSVNMFGARTNGPVNVDYFSNKKAEVKVIITQQEDESKVVQEHVYHNLNRGIFNYDLSYLPKMRYTLKVIVDGEVIFKNRIRLKE
ncbi:hypothetical protein MQE36_05980 [Zhouia spongiae]|uniref:Peptide-N-glycosidase F C-terminal domain-containing protein n=1 Tax=Zhouia spongiae TaxID=2202721 RepID=A0ABY3YQI7_9FLAO|nr:peptide-N-glycosidase F-related protein [Zhouia spongiae]UNY99895.1 hypothetical protein MQE36_05980 [Zhouia spongiae]